MRLCVHDKPLGRFDLCSNCRTLAVAFGLLPEAKHDATNEAPET